MALQRIMHVEDDESIRAVAEIALKDVAGFDLLSCESGQQALQALDSFRPELILLDVMMPEMDGLQTLAAIRARPEHRSLPVVFMTAKIQQVEKDHYLAAGALAVIDKPFDPMALGDMLSEIFMQYQSQDTL